MFHLFFEQQNEMACVCGNYHTITLSDDGVVHPFGENNVGQLGLGHKTNTHGTYYPTPISNLPKIKQTVADFLLFVLMKRDPCGHLDKTNMVNLEQATQQIAIFRNKFKIFLLCDMFLVD